MRRWLILALLVVGIATATRADLQIAQGNFAKRNGTGTQQVVISPAFTPKVIYFWGTNQTATGGAVGGNDWFGVTSGTPAAQNFGVAAYNIDNVATSDARIRIAQQACVIITGPTAITVVGAATLSSFNSNGFTLSWGTSDTNAYIIYYIALGGTDITNVLVGNRTWATSTGNQAFTSVGFLPNFIHIIGGGDGTAVDTGTADYLRDFGAALSTSSRWTVATSADDGDSMSPFVSGRSLVTTEMASKLNVSGSAVLAAADFVSFGSDGWTWNVTTAPASAHPFGFVAFNFANVANNVAIGTFNKCTTTDCNSDVTTGQGTVKGVLLFSRGATEGTTIVDDSRLAVGGSDFTNEGSLSASHYEPGAAGNTRVRQGISSSKAFILMDLITLNDVDAECDASAIANGFRTTWTTSDGVATTIAYIAFGEAAAGAPVAPPRRAIIISGKQYAAWGQWHSESPARPLPKPWWREGAAAMGAAWLPAVMRWRGGRWSFEQQHFL